MRTPALCTTVLVRDGRTLNGAVEQHASYLFHDSDELQLRIRGEIPAEGSFHLSMATFGGRRFLRLVLTSPHTSHVHVERLAERIRAIVRERTAAND